MAIIILKHSSLLSADENKMLFLKLEEIERFLNGREEQCNLPHFQIAHDHEHEFVTTDLVKRNESGFTDNEIDSMIKDLAMCKVKGLGSAAAFAASALKTEADKSAKHNSWCPKYEDQIIAPIKKDFKKAISSWPFWLRMLIENFESSNLVLMTCTKSCLICRP
ncbi:hypothetical protein MHU86_3944 [Fragilaria crotonensis]|nr:hypothetical protein MHU86_3944 [Fragilaria crotonensis]